MIYHNMCYGYISGHKKKAGPFGPAVTLLTECFDKSVDMLSGFRCRACTVENPIYVYGRFRKSLGKLDFDCSCHFFSPPIHKIHTRKAGM